MSSTVLFTPPTTRSEFLAYSKKATYLSLLRSGRIAGNVDKTVKAVRRFRVRFLQEMTFLSRNQVFNPSLYPLVLYFLAFSCAYVDIVLFVSIYGFLDLIFHFGAFWRFAIESKIFQMERIGVQLSLLGHLQDV